MPQRRSPLPTLLAVWILVLVSPVLAAADIDSHSYPTLTPVTHQTLPNGMQVLVAPSPTSDLETIDVWVGAGTRRETAETNGAAHFLEHMIFKGTPTRKPGEIDGAIEDLGGTLDASTSYDWAHFFVTVGASDAPAALDVLADAIRNAELRQDDMDQERPVILDEMARDQADPLQRLKDAVAAKVFPNHPYGRPLRGVADQVSAMKRQAVADFYRTYYVPSNVTLVLAGNMPVEDCMAMAKKSFGNWDTKPLPDDKILPAPLMTAPSVQNLTGAVSSGYLVMAFNAPSVHDKPDAWVMDVLLTLLGQNGNDRLETDLVHKQKLVTSITADYLTQHDPGMMTVSAVFDPQNCSRVSDAILAEIQSLRDTPIDAGDLAAAKHALLANYLFDVQTTSGRADALGFYNIIDSYDYDTQYIDHFESVTPAQIQTVALKYLNPDAYALVTLLPRTNPQTASLPRSR
ncbi:MAG: M16 family metallopeptidase [Capsulimonadaceae bacterium]